MDDGNEGVVVGEGRVKRETERAVLVAMSDDTEVWVPKSCLHDDSEVFEDSEDGREGTLVVKRWFAEKEGLDGGPPRRTQQAGARRV